jgi:PPOX class probable F420-dependent enzyme
MSVPVHDVAETKIDPFASIRTHRYINLTTVRKNGATVTTPVWIALEANRGYIVTDKKSGKVKRIRRNHNVEIAPSTHAGKPLGPSIKAKAHILSPEEWVRPHRLLLQKYGWQYRFFELLWKLQRTQHTFLEITPR